VDFDDMVYLPLRAMLGDRSLRRRLQRQFEYLLVDEFQDLNRGQLLFMQVLALPGNNLFVVGDDDQMIYGWRGAEVRHILDFPESFPESSSCLLSTNYRSSHRIVRHARWLIDHNRERVAKDIRSRPGADAGTFDIRLGRAVEEQARAAAAWMARQREARGAEWGDFAVLFRYQMHQFVVAAALDREGISHTPVDLGRLSATRVGRTVRSYLRVVLPGGRARPRDFATVLTHPRRFLPREVVARVTDWDSFESAPQTEGIDPMIAERLQGAVDSILTVRARLAAPAESAAAAVSAIAEEAGIGKACRGRGRASQGSEAIGEDVLLQTLLGVAGQVGAAEELLARMERPPNDDESPPEGQTTNAVALSTIHSTKGNEYAHVVYFDVRDPSASGPEEVEEERRVAYVAATRAIDSLLVTAPKGKQSAFVREMALNPALADLSSGRLRLRLWGHKIRRVLRLSALAAKSAGGPSAIDDLRAELRFRRRLRRTNSR
jgi:DNA helicase-2/ATP-dependent DNA helicase PcrA